MEDREIVMLYLNRSEKAVKETENKYGKYCHSISYNILKNHEDSEECVNDTYTKTWNSIPPSEPVSLMAYLAKIVRNISLNVYRKSHTAKRGLGEIPLILDELDEVITSQNSVEDEIINSEKQAQLSKVLNSFLRSIDENSRNIMIRRYFYAESISDIAVRYSFSESKVKSMLFRNRKKLVEHLQKGGVTI